MPSLSIKKKLLMTIRASFAQHNVTLVLNSAWK